MLGQSDPARARRRRWPASKIQDVASSSSSTLVGRAWFERPRMRVPCAMGEVEDAAAHQRGRAVGEHVAETRRRGTRRVRRGDGEPEPRVAEKLELLLQRPVVGQRALVVLSLVLGEASTEAFRRRRSRLPCRRRRARRCGRGGAIRAPDVRAETLRGPGRLARHSPRISARSGAGRVDRRTNTAIGGSSSIPFSVSSQPAAEPADELGNEVDVRAGYRRSRSTCAPTGR